MTLGIENTVKVEALELHFDGADSCVGTMDKAHNTFATLAKREGWHIADPIGIRFVAALDLSRPRQLGSRALWSSNMWYGIKHVRELFGKVKKVICGQC